MLMASSSFDRFGLRVVVLTLLCISFLIYLSSISVGVGSSYKEEGLQRRKVVLGSRPPGCVDKCMNCKPCKATLIIPHHQKGVAAAGYRISYHREDDTYYLLSWKCSCGNKLFQP